MVVSGYISLRITVQLQAGDDCEASGPPKNTRSIGLERQFFWL